MAFQYENRQRARGRIVRRRRLGGAEIARQGEEQARLGFVGECRSAVRESTRLGPRGSTISGR